MRTASPATRLFIAASSAALVATVVAASAAVVTQRADVGIVAFQNSGSPAAQDSFLAGLAQLHNFEYAAAAELFRRAEQIDPGFAMAAWGEAMTFNHPVWMEQDLGAARRALERLGPTRDTRAAKAKTPREKDYLRAVEVLYGDGDKVARDNAYADAMAGIYRAYPGDPDAAAFYALSLLGTAHAGRDFSLYMRAAAIVEPVFREYPRHPGAAHYLIHAYDDPIHAPLGLRAARAYSTIAPSAGHAQHMTSHIFVALGLWDDLVTANEAAVRVVNAGLAGRSLAPRACGHYNFWLEYGYLQQGRFVEAKKLVAECYAAARRAAAPAPAGPVTQILDPDNTPVGSFAGMRLRYLLDTEEWGSEVAGWMVETAGQRRSEIAMEFGTGYAAAKSGKRADAAGALGRLSRAVLALETELAASAVDRAATLAKEWAQILESQLSAVIAMQGGDAVAALETLRATTAKEEQMPYEFGPPAVDKPTYELLGELMLVIDRPKDARATFEKALARTPERTSSLKGLMQAVLKSGDERRAGEIRAQLRTIWHHADRLPDEVR